MQILDTSSFCEYFDKIHERTLRVARCIPADKIEWTYRDGKFTLGDLVRHIAAINRHMFAETVAGRPSRYAGCGRDLADGYEEVIDYSERLHRETVHVIRALNPSDLLAKCKTPDGASLTTWKWLRAMLEHEIHHRGQIYLYLAMLGVETPPLYGLTSEQVRDRSVH
jgi:uncharacterized damage-inducible protein DinB